MVFINKLLPSDENFKDDKAIEKSAKILPAVDTNNMNKMNNGINGENTKPMTLRKDESIAGVRSIADVSFEGNSDLEVREETLDVVQKTHDNSIVNHSNSE